MWKWGEGGWWGGHNASTAFYHRASIKSLAHNMYSNIGHSRKEYVMMGFRCPGHTKCNSPSFCFHMHQTNSQRHNLEHYCTIDQASKGLYTFLCILQHLRQLWWDWVNCSAVLQQIHHTLNGSLSWAESAGGDQVPPYLITMYTFKLSHYRCKDCNIMAHQPFGDSMPHQKPFHHFSQSNHALSNHYATGAWLPVYGTSTHQTGWCNSNYWQVAAACVRFF